MLASHQSGGGKKNFDKDNFSEVLFYKDGEYNYPEKWNFVLLLTINFLSNFIWKYSLWFMVAFTNGQNPIPRLYLCVHSTHYI